jgi:hypothetical protein
MHRNNSIYGKRKGKRRDSSVGIATGYGLDDRLIWCSNPGGAGYISLRRRVETGSGAHQTSYSMGNGALPMGIKRPGRETTHLPPSNAEVKE